MYYMNTDRDNFHDWARDKPDTSFDRLQGRRPLDEPEHDAIRWGRLVVMALLGVALVAGFKFLAGL